MKQKIIFKNFIDEKGLKKTRQRNQILEAFLSAGGHSSTEELHRSIRDKHPSIGYATVYRTLKLFAQSGIAREIHFGDGQTRYEPLVEGEHHDHLVCQSCGSITEFTEYDIEQLQEEVARRHGFTIQNHKLELYGICSVCVGRNQSSESDSKKNGGEPA